MKKISIFFIMFFITFVFLSANAEPVFIDPQYEVEEFVTNLDWPTTMTFVENDILILQKNDGKVVLIRDEKISNNPILDLEVNFLGEFGLLGIINNNSTVYIYLTESAKDGGDPIAHRVYKYQWDGNTLQDPILLNEFPTSSISQHAGGIMTVNSNGTIFVIVGDTNNPEAGMSGPTQNILHKNMTDGGGIILVGLDPKIKSPSKSADPFSHYYAIGIRNSFGLTVDPVTGHLWDTENGLSTFDEVNLVLPKFNSGWEKIQGPATQQQINELEEMEDLGFHYEDPKFSWYRPVAVTSLIFIESNNFEKYRDYLFVADCTNGNLYKFKLNSERNGFVFNEPWFKDKVHSPGEPLNEILLGMGFGCITDMKFGPDGLLYIVSLTEGKIFRIKPGTDFERNSELITYSINELKPNANLEKGNFFSADLSGIDLNSANLANSDFRLANLSGTNLAGANLNGVDLSNADLSGADLSNADLTKVLLKQAILTKTKLVDSKLTSIHAKGASFAEADLTGAKLDKAILMYTNLSNAIIRNANVQDANIYSADLVHADLSNSDFSNADMRTSDLSNTNLSFSNLKSTDLRLSKLDGAVFTKTILIDTNLKSVNMTGIDLTKAITTEAESKETKSGGGCLIATATFGTELDPQVQMLREIRDNVILGTKSGTAFMAGFNQLYYSFSPTIADFERENPLFKETVKLSITPLLFSLSILNYVDINSEENMISIGISTILLNILMYFIGPIMIIQKVRGKISNK